MRAMRPAGAAAITASAEPRRTWTRVSVARVGPRPAWCVPYMWNGTGIVYNRVRRPPPRAWADLWSPQPEGPAHHAGRSRGRAGRVPEESSACRSAPPTRRSLRRAEREAIAQKPLLRAYLNAEVRDQLVAGDVLAAQLWSTTAQQAIDAAPQLAFVYPGRGLSALLRLRGHPAREPPRGNWRTSFSTTCCARRSRPASCKPPGPRRPTPAAQALLPEAVREQSRRFIRRRR